jgi:hypothetical protein
MEAALPLLLPQCGVLGGGGGQHVVTVGVCSDIGQRTRLRPIVCICRGARRVLLPVEAGGCADGEVVGWTAAVVQFILADLGKHLRINLRAGATL